VRQSLGEHGGSAKVVAVTYAEEADVSHPWALLHGYNFGDDIDDVQDSRSATASPEC
jgi:hypothetical protein